MGTGKAENHTPILRDATNSERNFPSLLFLKTIGLKNNFIHRKTVTLMPNSITPENFTSTQHTNSRCKRNNKCTYTTKELKKAPIKFLYQKIQRRKFSTSAMLSSSP